MQRLILLLAVVTLAGCASGGYPVGRGPDVVIVGDDRRERDGDYEDDDDYDDDGEWRKNRGKKNGHYKGARGNGRNRANGAYRYGGYRTLTVDRRYHPPLGWCRVWYAGRDVRVQPRATTCSQLYGGVPARAFILYANSAWDGDYDWYRHQQAGGRVPTVIVRISQARRR